VNTMSSQWIAPWPIRFGSGMKMGSPTGLEPTNEAMGWDERRAGRAPDTIRAGTYRWGMEKPIRTGNLTLPRLEA
jgi:hypothetical protein